MQQFYEGCLVRFFLWGTLKERNSISTSSTECFWEILINMQGLIVFRYNPKKKKRKIINSIGNISGAVVFFQQLWVNSEYYHISDYPESKCIKFDSSPTNPFSIYRRHTNKYFLIINIRLSLYCICHFLIIFILNNSKKQKKTLKRSNTNKFLQKICSSRPSAVCFSELISVCPIIFQAEKIKSEERATKKVFFPPFNDNLSRLIRFYVVESKKRETIWYYPNTKDFHFFFREKHQILLSLG